MRLDRLRQSDLATALDVMDDDRSDGSAAFLAITVAESSYPTTAGVVYAINALTLDGLEDEGAGASYTSDLTTWYAVNIGSAVPPIGSKVIVHAVGGRLVFDFNG